MSDDTDMLANEARRIILDIARRYGLDAQAHPQLSQLLACIEVLRQKCRDGQ